MNYRPVHKYSGTNYKKPFKHLSDEPAAVGSMVFYGREKFIVQQVHNLEKSGENFTYWDHGLLAFRKAFMYNLIPVETRQKMGMWVDSAYIHEVIPGYMTPEELETEHEAFMEAEMSDDQRQQSAA